MIYEPTNEQQQLEQEFAEQWDALDHGPHDHLGDRTDAERWWIAARVYSERLVGVTI